MVRPGWHVLGMESVGGPEFLTVDLWETFVNAWLSRLYMTDLPPPPFRSGRRKKRFLVRQTLDITVIETYRVGQLHNHRGR